MTDEAQITTETEEAPDTGETTDWKAEAEKWKTHSRKWEGTAKQNADAAKRLAEIEEAQKTAEQKAADKAAEAERERNEAKLEALRLSVALDKGLTKTQAKRLIGTTEEELAADADDLLASFAKDTETADKPEVSTRPKERMKSGATGFNDEPPQLTREDLKTMSPEAIVKAKAEGRLAKLLGQ